MADEHEAVAIEVIPTVLVENVTLDMEQFAKESTRETWLRFKARWDIPTEATNDQRNDRWQSLNQFWIVCHDMTNSSNESSLEHYDHYGNEVHEGSVTHTSDTLEISRSPYYPLGGSGKLRYVSCQPKGWNEFGSSIAGGLASIYFLPPKKPAVKQFEFSNGVCTSTVTVPDHASWEEVYDTKVWMYVSDTDSSGNYSPTPSYPKSNDGVAWSEEQQKWISLADGPVYLRQSSIDVKFTHPRWTQGLNGSFYVEVHALSRGLGGDSEETITSYKYSPASVPAIQNVNVSSLDYGSDVSITFREPGNWSDGITLSLQRIKTTKDYAKAIAQSDLGWTDVPNASASRPVSGFHDNIGTAQNPGAYPSDTEVAIAGATLNVFYRLKMEFNGVPTYSDPFKVPKLTNKFKTAADDAAFVESVVLGDDGESFQVVIGWNNDDSDGTEVSWAQHDDEWRSNSDPPVKEVPNSWKDPVSRSSHDNTALITLRSGLTADVPYFVRARRYLNPPEGASGVQKSYGEYGFPPSTMYPAVPTRKPESVVLYGPMTVVTGRPINVWWVYSGDYDQTAWSVSMVSGNTSYVLDSGTDATGSIDIPSEKYQPLLGNGTTVELFVSMTTGGEWVSSEHIKVGLQTEPVVEFLASDTIYAQPMTLNLKAPARNIDVLLTITSTGIGSVGPANKINQLNGDTVWTDKVSPSWRVSADGSCVAAVTTPLGLPLYQGGTYQVTAIGVDRDTGLKSDQHTSYFTVDYSHRAAPPSNRSKCVGDSVHKHAVITPMRSAQMLSSDVCDIYRWSPDCMDLVAKDVKFGSRVRDRLAPYSKNGGLKYRIVTRTKDGDTEWIDIPYNVYGYSIRFDWGDNRFLEVPYNLTMSDAYTKGYESAVYMDGSILGDWDGSVQRTGSFTTQMVRLTTREQIDMCRELGQYSGPVFVRQPNGSAFAANVNVSKIDESYESLVLDVSFSVERIDTVDGFTVLSEDIMAPEDDPQENVITRSIPVYWDEDSFTAPISFTDVGIPELGFVESYDVDTMTAVVHDFDEIVEYKLSTALDGYSGWPGTASQMILEPIVTYDGELWFGRGIPQGYFRLTSMTSQASTYMAQAAQLPSNKFMLNVTYTLKRNNLTLEPLE